MRFTEATALAAATFVANLVWEVAQAPLYLGHEALWQTLPMCAWASLGDVFIVAAIYVFFAILFRDHDWAKRLRASGTASVAIVGGLVAIAVEWWALSTGRWQYAAMPILPFVNVGLLPVLQMTILPPVLFLAYARYAAAK